MRFKLFSATRFQRAVSPGIGLLMIGLWSLGCGGAASRGTANGGDAQPAADSDAQAAVVVVRDYLDALDERDYARAHDHWFGNVTLEEFQRQRANIAAVEADIGKARLVDGSSKATVPVELQITHTDGSQECARGAYHLGRRPVPTPRPSLPWLIASSDIKEC